MFISRLEWDEYRVQHLARHRIEPDEVWEVCEAPRHIARREGRNRYRLYGQTTEGATSLLC
jgi:hypothetical protein